MEDRDRLAKTRSEAADGLGGQRDLGHEHAGRTTGCQNTLDGREVDLGFAGSGDAIDEYHIAMGIQACALNLRERLLLAVRKCDRRLAACRGQSSLLAAAAPRTTLLNHHNAALFECPDGSGHAVVEQVEVARRDRTAPERLDKLTLTNRGFGRRIVETLGRKHDPTVLDRFDGGALNGPHTVIALDHARASARRQEQAQALGKRRDIFAAHPARNACSLSGKERSAKDGLDALDARGVEGVVALQVGKLRRDIDDIAGGCAVAKMDQDRRADLGFVGKGLWNTVGKWLG